MSNNKCRSKTLWVRFTLGLFIYSTYARFPEKLKFLTPCYAHIRISVREVTNASF